MTETRWTLGQRVSGQQVYRQITSDTLKHRSIFTWAPHSWNKNRVEGIYIGRRVYLEGYNSDYEGNIWNRTGSISVALIVNNPSQNPIPVLFDSLANGETP